MYTHLHCDLKHCKLFQFLGHFKYAAFIVG